MKSLLAGQCPKCNEGQIFKSKGVIFKAKLPQMNEHCPNCNHKFEKEPGFFLGAMYVSYALGVFQALVAFGISYLLTDNVLYWVLTPALVLLLFSMFNFRWGRIAWIHIFRY